MKTNGNGNGNGNGSNIPYYGAGQSPNSVGTTSSHTGKTTKFPAESDGGNRSPSGDDDFIDVTTDELQPASRDEAAAGKRKQRQWRKWGAISIIALLVIGVAGAGVYYALVRKLQLDVIVGRGRQPAASGEKQIGRSEPQTGKDQTEAAVKQARQAAKGDSSAEIEKTSVTPPIDPGAQINQPPGSPIAPRTDGSTAPPNLGKQGLAGTFPAPHNAAPKLGTAPGQPSPTAERERETTTGRNSGTETAQNTPNNNSPGGTSRRTAGNSSRTNNRPASLTGRVENSIDMPAIRAETAAAKTPITNVAAAQAPKTAARRNSILEMTAASAAVAVPNFGTMLPVRSLGAIYTLRGGSLSRFELTRDVSGDGWHLPAGTVFVASLKGGEFDRAFLTTVGFIDPNTKKLVKIGGDVLGGDGANGLPGKRRKVSKRGMRFLAEAGRGAVGILQSALGGRNGATTVITGSLPNTAAAELGAMGGRGNNQREFVEVQAGAFAYIMITDLPSEIEGVDAASELEPANLSEMLETGGRSERTGLTDAELARLLESGSKSEIEAALPRMTPEMRRVAESILRQSEK